MTIQNSLCLVAASAVLLVGNCAWADTVYVSNEDDNNIEKFTTNEVGTLFAGEFGLPTNGVDGPWGIAFDNAGDLFEANYNNNTIEKFNPNGGCYEIENTKCKKWGVFANSKKSH